MRRRVALKEVCLEISADCAARCLHCSSAYDDRGAVTLDTNTLLRVLTQLRDLGASIVELSGGEPLLHAGLFTVIRHAAELGLDTRLYTSGVTVDGIGGVRGIGPELADRLQEAGLGKVIFNLQGSCASVHELVNGVPGSFNLILAGIRTLKRGGAWVGVHFVPMRPNATELVKLLEVAASLGVDEVAVLRFVAQGRGLRNQDQLKLSPTEFASVVMTASELASRYPQGFVRLGSPMNFCSFFNKAVRSTECAAGVSTLTILPDGSVIPCPAFKGLVDYVAGNVRSEPLMGIWSSSPVWKEFRTFSMHELRGPCATCRYLAECRGRCAAQRIRAWGDIYQGPDPDCARDALEAISQGAVAQAEPARAALLTPGRETVGTRDP